jgi:RNA polymerase sigma-70 factor (ECF subfamily)
VRFTDEEVVARVRAGERSLFEVLMRRYNRRLYRIARSIVGPFQAEDVMQQAYLHSFAHLAHFAGTGPFSTWLTTIAVHEALAQVKRDRRGEQVCARDDVDALRPATEVADAPDVIAGERQLLRRLEHAIDELPDIYRAVFVLRTVEGVSTDEASLALGVSVEVVKVRLHRARALLREAIGIDVDEAAARGTYPFAGADCDRMVAAVLGRIRAQPV